MVSLKGDLLCLVLLAVAFERSDGVTLSSSRVVDRRGFAAIGITTTLGIVSAGPCPAVATKMSDAELAAIVTKDVTERQFLATADFTRSLYDDSATFTDEIDTYTLDKFVIGTKKLFDPTKSQVELTSPVLVNAEEASFTFQESLCFNIPILKPVVSLSGKVVLKRDPDTGLFTSYREFWDQSPTNVILSARI